MGITIHQRFLLKINLLAVLVLCFCALESSAQNFTNKGKDFWIGYGNHINMSSGSAPTRMQLFITSDVSTTGLVTISSVGFSQPITITANTITTVDIPSSAYLTDEGLYNHGIHVTALKPVVVYGFQFISQVSAATVCLPTSTLGKNYYSVNFTQISNQSPAYSYFFVVAADTGTTNVEITPAKLTKAGRPAGIPFNVTLTQGQIYQVLSSTDLTGSTVRSISGNGIGCKKIGVYCGSSKISIGSSSGSGDNLFQQMYPTATWGKAYFAVPSINSSQLTGQNNYFRIFKSTSGGNVYIDGTIIPAARFVNNQYFDTLTKTVHYITADSAILMAQIFPSQGQLTNSSPGDPEMIFLNPVEQSINNVTLNSMQSAPTESQFTQHYINVEMQNLPSAINTFIVDGVLSNTGFAPIPSNPAYAYKRFAVTVGAHTLSCDSGFNGIVYGFGSSESYGYSAGSTLSNFSQYVGIGNDSSTAHVVTTCKGTPFHFSITVPYTISQMKWYFTGLFNDTIVNLPVYDSTWVVAGLTFYRYPLLHTYLTGSVGTFPIKVLAYNNAVDGCSGEQEIDFDLVINPNPIANFGYTFTGCLSDSVHFFDSSNGLGTPINKWRWDFGDAQTSLLQNPVHRYMISAPTFTTKLYGITSTGCFTDTMSKVITITPPPVAKFGYPTEVCLADSASFRDSSTIPSGTIASWHWNFGDASTSTLQNPKHKWAAAGTYIVTLYVTSANGCSSLITPDTVIVNQQPTAGFGYTTPTCATKTITFTDSSLANSGSITEWHWDLGDGTTFVLLNNNPFTHIYIIGGTYTVTLTVKTDKGCTSSISIHPITINATPVANFTLPGNLCLPGAIANFINTTTISDGTSASLTYLWNFGDGTATSTVVSPSHTYTGIGPYNVTLSAISISGCRHDTTKALVTIFGQPIAKFTAPSELCLSDSASFTDLSTAPGSSVSQWFWDFGDASTSTLQNPKHKWNAPGSYVVKLHVKSLVGCFSIDSMKTVIVDSLPVAKFGYSIIRCPGTITTFTDSSSANSGSLTEWHWDYGDGGTFSQVTGGPVTHIYTTAGTYTVTLWVKSSKGCISAIFSKTVLIHVNPVPNFTLPGNLCLPGASANFINTTSISDGTLPFVTYIWNFGDGSPTNTQVSPTHVYNGTGPYSITLTALSSNGCSHDTTKALTTIFAQPVTTFSAPSEICLSDSASFADLSTAPGSSVTQWFWNFGDGGTSTLQNPKHKWNASGSYIVTHHVESAVGCFSSDSTKTVIVDPLPEAKFGFSPIRCAGGIISFTDSSVASPATISEWHWDFGDGGTLTQVVAGTITHTYTVAGVYTVTLWVKSSIGCSSIPFPKPVTINPNPVANFNIPAVCIPDGNAQFNDLSTVTGGIATRTWNFGDLGTSTSANTVHQYVTGGLYNVTLTVTSNNGCVSDTVKSVSVFNAPTPSFIITDSTKLCSNLPVTLTNTSLVNGYGTVNKIEIYWDYLNDPTNKTTDTAPASNGTYTNQYPVFGTPLTNTYRVLIMAYSASGCSSQYFQDITINASPQVQFNSIAPVCAEVLIDPLTAASEVFNLPGAGIYSGDGILISPIFIPRIAGAGTHVIRYTYLASNGCSSYAEQPIVVNPTPSVLTSKYRNIIEGDTVILSTISTGNGLTFLWTPQAYLNDVTSGAPFGTPHFDQHFDVSVTSIDGCISSDSVFVKVVKDFIVPNTFTPNNDGINDKWVIDYLSLYPGHKLQVFNRYGQVVFESENYSNAWDGTYKGKPLPAGTYYYIIDLNGKRKPKTGYVTILR